MHDNIIFIFCISDKRNHNIKEDYSWKNLQGVILIFFELNNNHKKIAVFDSGIGGFTFLREAVKVLPNEDFIYYADTDNVPYGTKSKEEVKKYIFKAVDFCIEPNCNFIEQGVLYFDKKNLVFIKLGEIDNFILSKVCKGW